ncbi:MAG TPA: N-6 DNA methylase, partial [Pirellulales bacterium]|nr:N-6 DNA methylase [Pirellulales bacterium]
DPRRTTRTRRKKEGAFYTPAFITRYIIEQALGGVLRDRFEALRLAHVESAPKKGPARAALADPNVYTVGELKPAARTALVKFWEAWQDELGATRLLDPACGSGAFLIEAFDQLHAAYEAVNARLRELGSGQRTLFDLDKRILENNLYGVDLNEEAIEICRLSLWIKTAERGKVLTSLDHTIRVGNSVVSDPAVHPRAFDWRAAFPEVFSAGGFDVVVGNPPYIRQEWLAPYKPHWEQKFKSYHGTADIFVYFFELGLSILRENGRLAFITSGSWVRSSFGEPLRRYLVDQAAIESMVDFGEFQPFEDAEMIRPSITVLQKKRGPARTRIYKWLTEGEPPQNLSEVIAGAPTMGTAHLSGEAWELEADDVLALRRKLASVGQTLNDYTGGIFRGVTTGANEAFVIPTALRDELVRKDPKSAEIIKPFVQGTHLRPWYIESSDEHLIFPRRGIAIEEFPAVLEYLTAHREALEPKPPNWPASRKWPGRKPGAYRWYEIQDSVDYWQNFEVPKIVWPDISKLPRFSIDSEGRYLGNTAYIIPRADYYLLGILSSWAAWFYISKTAQPLRLRAGRWQYRLIAQFMEQVPIPNAHDAERAAIADLSAAACRLGQSRYELQSHVRQRLIESFGMAPDGSALGVLNEKAQAWSDASLAALGAALKTSFKLVSNPLKNPRVADEWEPYLKENRAKVDAMTRQLADAEAELNDRVYRLFALTPAEVKLLQREVEH